MDTGECQPLYHGIRDFYEGMNMKITQQIPMLLVERQALNEALEGEKDVSPTIYFHQKLCLDYLCVYIWHYLFPLYICVCVCVEL